jgi:hypothetical protein
MAAPPPAANANLQTAHGIQWATRIPATSGFVVGLYKLNPVDP